MIITLGVDTGGTYTDAVLLRDETKVVATAKSLTTRSDLAIGIEKAVRGVLNQAQVSPNEISLASLSTTLATNALVEGHGGRVGLVYIGFDARDLNSHGLKDASNGDPVITLAGGHDYSGTETALRLSKFTKMAFPWSRCFCVCCGFTVCDTQSCSRATSSGNNWRNYRKAYKCISPALVEAQRSQARINGTVKCTSDRFDL